MVEAAAGFPAGGGGKVGCGTIVIAIIAALVFGADPMQTIGALSGDGSVAPTRQVTTTTDAQEVCGANQYSREACNALSSLNQTWAPEFSRGRH